MSANGRRQPVRSSRTATSRPSNYYAKPPYLASQKPEEPAQPEPHGFFPAITYFTDALSALPRETIRHFTLIKETEGKAYPPAQHVNELVNKIHALPPPPHRAAQPHTQAVLGFSLTNSVNGSAPSSVVDGSIPAMMQLDGDVADQPLLDENSATRIRLFEDLRNITKDLNNILDEKIVVMNTANETLDRQLMRLRTALPHVEKEISEEARLGSNTHWALAHMKAARRGVTAQGARHVQNANGVVGSALREADIAAARSEVRREALQQARAHKRMHVDSDFDERPASKRAAGPGKNKRTQELLAAEGKTAPNAQVKRRRIEKPAAAQVDRSAPAAANGRMPSSAQGAAPVDGRKKPKPAAVTATKKRTAAESPSAAPSPTQGTFSTKPASVQSPRPTAARVRQNSTLSLKAAQAKERPGSTSSSSKGAHLATPELRGVAESTGRSVAGVKAATKDSYTLSGGAQVVEQDGVLGALVVEGPTGNSDYRREETVPAEEAGPEIGAQAPESIDETANMDAQAPAMARSRSTRGANLKHAAAASPVLQPSRSHHKLGRQGKARSSPQADESSGEDARASRQGSEHSDNGSGEEDPLYCICQQPSYGSMVACDNRQCPWEWFHLECVGLTQAPEGNTKWYCNDCKKNMKRPGRAGNGTSR